MKRRLALNFLCVALSACSDSAPVTGSPFDPVQFFSGRSHGEATLRTLFGPPRHVSVDSVGVPDARGGLVLDQRIAEQGKAPRTRRWVLHPSGPNRWTGTLTDAAGPVTVERTGSGVTIRYRMHSGPQVRQSLRQQPGGEVANHLTASRWGIQLARLDETIRKLD